ncbi:MAG: hypothetical protein FKGGLIKP_00522 [Sodalis sp. Fse]|nr:MAG: hypothetical protein FKGGLIKP_00522 [Sodalis sp. Fse]
MAKQKFKIINWTNHNKTLIKYISLKFWLDIPSIAAWYGKIKELKKYHTIRHANIVISTIFILKLIFSLTQNTLQGFIDFIFQLINISLHCQGFTYINKRAKRVNVIIKTSTSSNISHIADTTRMNILDESAWKIKTHSQKKHWSWHKLQTIDTTIHDIIHSNLLQNAEALLEQLKQTYRKIKETTKIELMICMVALIDYWLKNQTTDNHKRSIHNWHGYNDKNQTLANQRLTKNNDHWKQKLGYTSSLFGRRSKHVTNKTTIRWTIDITGP